MITPLRDYLVLQEIKEEKNVSGLIVGANADTKESPRAKVLSVGPLVKEIKVDQVVVFKPHLFDKFYPDLKSEPSLIGKEEAVIAIYD